MSELFGINFAEEAFDAFGDELTEATLHRRTGVAPDLWGKAVETFAQSEAAGLLTKFDTQTRVRLGYAVSTMKIMLLANNAAGPIPEPTDGDRVSIDGKTFTVQDVTFGPGKGSYDMAGVPD